MASRPQAPGGAADSLQARLRTRRPELEQAALARIGAISDPSEVADPEYLTGLRSALSAALDYGFAATRDNEAHPPQIPILLLGQARMAARNGVGLDTVLRRYCAGYALLNDLLVSEAEQSGASQLGELKSLLRALALRFDRLLVAVSEEYSREAASCAETSGRRHLERVLRVYAAHYNRERPHRALALEPPESATTIRRPTVGAIERRDKLGGLIHESHRAAA